VVTVVMKVAVRDGDGVVVVVCVVCLQAWF